MLAAWGVYLKTHNPGVVDAFWSISILTAGLVFLSQNSLTFKSGYVGFLLCIWALRLSLFLYFTRIKPGHVEQRYLSIEQGWTMKKSLAYLLNFQFQAVLGFVIALPLFFFTIQWNWLNILGVFLIKAGIVWSTVADVTLFHYKKSNHKGLCRQGLWQYSRHPNYFFEWLAWVGFSCAAINFSLPYTLLSLISPLCLLIIFLWVTGPLTERQSIKSRGDEYRQYQQQVPMFFPFKRR